MFLNIKLASFPGCRGSEAPSRHLDPEMPLPKGLSSKEQFSNNLNSLLHKWLNLNSLQPSEPVLRRQLGPRGARPKMFSSQSPEDSLPKKSAEC